MKINLDFIYPIGTIYETTSTVHPNVLFGGTWELYGQGRVTVCIDTSQSEFDVIGETGGEKTHKLTENEMPKHNHSAAIEGGNGDMYVGGSFLFGKSPLYYIPTNSKGGDKAHNNLQPYIVVYRYRRIA